MIKKYNEYLNEGSSIHSITNKILKFFKDKFGKKSWIYYVKYLIDNKQLPGSYNDTDLSNHENKVDIYIPEGYFERLSSGKVKKWTEEEILNEIKNKDNKSKSDNNISEAYSGGDINDDDDVVTLSYPVESGRNSEVVRNVSASELKDRIRRVYKKNLLRDIRHEAEDYAKGSKYERIKTNALFIWGAPGIGKTAILKQLGKEFDMPVYEFHLAQMEATDMIGIPEIQEIKDKETGKKYKATVYCLPEIFPEDNGNGNGGILFFDELNRANQLVLSAALPLTLEGKIEDYTLPSKWIVIAAGNRPSDLPATSQSKLKDDPVLWNRFAHVNYNPTVKDFEEYSLDRPWINPFLIAFLTKNPDFYHKFKANDPNPVNPTPRKWEDASAEDYRVRNMDWSKKLDLNKLRDIYSRHVGKQAADKFIEYIKLSEYISDTDINAIYNKPKHIYKMPTRIDIEYAIMISIAYHIQPKGKITPEQYENVTNFIFDSVKGEKVTRFLSVFFRAQDGGFSNPTGNPQCQKIKNDVQKKWYDNISNL
ncbi:MoxR family ATPase [Candidatus Dojkabacteria bacterium]|jgi:hypothetical protein|nr:MoxR family ATPase [Candidatus Dojkabacteria bacterium]